MRGSCRCAEKLANTERHLDVSKSHALRAEDRTDELKQLNRSIFRPVITFNKDAKRAAQEAKIQQRYDDDRDEREKAMMDIRDTHNRLGRAATYGRRDDDDDGEAIGGQGSGRIRTGAEQAIRKEQRKRYQFDATASDDEMEDELDDNLNEISDMTKRLKALGSAMGEELDNQNIRIGRITEKTDGLDNKLFRNTQRVGSLLCSCAIVLTTLRSSTRSSRPLVTDCFRNYNLDIQALYRVYIFILSEFFLSNTQMQGVQARHEHCESKCKQPTYTESTRSVRH